MSSDSSKKARRTSRRKKRRGLLLGLLLTVILGGGVICWSVFGKSSPAQPAQEPTKALLPGGTYYCAGVEAEVTAYDARGQESGTIVRGTELTIDNTATIDLDGGAAYATNLEGKYLPAKNLVTSPEAAVLPHTLFVKTSQSLRLGPSALALGALVEKGEQVVVVGCDRLNPDGTAHLYRVRADRGMGYIPTSYLTSDRDEARKMYDEAGTGAVHLGRGDRYGGGKAGNLDFYPRQKLQSQTNPMPKACYSLYLDSSPDTMGRLDEYLELAASTSINTFVVDIMDGSSIAYKSEVMQQYSPTAYENGAFTMDEYAGFIQRIRDAGFYVIGRITAFNDDYFSYDHPEYSISDKNGKRLEVSGMYWPSAFCRYAWEYKVALSVEAVENFHFNEIQYDYVRFPDGTYSYEADNNINYHNDFGESKAQAIQRFLLYACDVLHEMDVYVSADVFGETSNPYVASYGQYFPAISNVVDAISGMPYPDHFEAYGDFVPWTEPYETISDWAESVVIRQSETPTPAIVRTWVQAYDAIRPPYNEYGPDEVWAEIQALLDNGLDGGFITWNASASISKYTALKPAFDKLS